ncbi:stalk domain-containing protein [Paenibacillus sp. Soil750]|uniref:stalk domain-containing protein n=1 Tax=Paenibacillus sp. Soil750 TaxID=1736398 RepID=UPI0006FF8566|nr:stalk domain-containing protein [Paenibacillus sp. Soil750]KRE57451.1 hypothetical protein ASL11_31545 [Paenibacillus sp. Soil750]
MKKFILGLLIGIGLAMTTAVFASESIQALLFPAKIKINGQEKKLDSEYQILNVNGHAYVPIRYVAENLGVSMMTIAKRFLLPMEIPLIRIKVTTMSMWQT